MVLVLCVLRPFVVEAYVLPTGSMVPTIRAGERIMVDKLEKPRRRDVVAYHVGTQVYCKRLVGLPGERLRFNDGNLYVNEQLVIAPAVVTGRYHMMSIMRYRDGQIITLADDEFFVVGDNVTLSYDSRMVGPSKWSSMIGVADFLYWPMNRFQFLR